MRDVLARLKKWLKNEDRLIWFEYGALSFVILLPLLLPGYILTLDLVFTPHFLWPTELTNTYLLEIVLWAMHWILPGDVIEKIILFLILILSGVGMHRLMHYAIKGEAISKEYWRMALYFAGIFYMINPFTYSRFMAGQWMVLLGYALVPFFVLTLLRLAVLPTKSTAIQLALWVFSIVTVSLHHIGIVLLLGVMTLSVIGVKYRSQWRYLKRFMGYLGLSALIVLGLSLFWLVPAVLGVGSVGLAIADFGQTDFEAFATNGHGAFGPIGEVVRLQGFWAEARQLYILPQSFVPLWGLVFFILWLVIITGAVQAWKSHRSFALLGIGCIVLGIIISASPLISWVSQFIPLLAGYREPHKFVSLVVLGYGILGAFGVAYLGSLTLKRFGEIGSQATTIMLVALPFIITPTMLWGFASQLVPRSYPSEWSAMNNTLKAISPSDRVLFLPWHQYMEYGFSGRLIANPAEKFFEVPMVISDEPEFRNVSPTVPDEEKRIIATALGRSDDLSSVLIDRNIRYILLAKEKDTVDYSYLDGTTHIHLIQEDAKLKLYRVGDER